jgi:uncharacterized membrane protein YphA (DoxX/SURF4 family)
MTRLLRPARRARGPENDPRCEKPDQQMGIPPAAPWRLATRVAFRFFLAYVALFFLIEMRIIYSLLGVFGNDLPAGALAWQYHLVRPVVTWVGAHMLGVDTALVEPVQSGDQRFFWVLAFCWLLGAAVVTVVWSVIDRRRTDYVWLHKWFHVVVRICLAAQLFSFGFAKVFPLQMSLPLTRLVEPYGNFGMLDVLWSQVGSSQPYEILLGCAEVTAGVLLVVPRTTMLGALLASVELTQVLILNVTYQVPLKIFPFHLLLLSLLLLAPHAARLLRFFITDQGVAAVKRPQLFQTPRAVSIALAVQILFGAWLAGSQMHKEWKLWGAIGTSGQKPPLYGIWNVVAFSMDDENRPPLTTDGERWKRLIVDTSHPYQPGPVSSQRMDGSIVDYTATFDAKSRSMELARLDEPAWSARLAFTQSMPERLALDGVLNGHTVHMRLDKVSLSSFPITQNGPRWVQDRPFQPRVERR